MVSAMADDKGAETHGIVLFDGVCNLCNATVQFILDRDRAGYFRFAALQSEAGAKALTDLGHAPVTGEPDSIMLIENNTVYDRSDAALRVARRLDGAWPLLAVTLIVPRVVRDLVYRFIARNRYRWFGRTEECRIPTPELRARFLT